MCRWNKKYEGLDTGKTQVFQKNLFQVSKVAKKVSTINGSKHDLKSLGEKFNFYSNRKYLYNFETYKISH